MCLFSKREIRRHFSGTCVTLTNKQISARKICKILIFLFFFSNAQNSQIHVCMQIRKLTVPHIYCFKLFKHSYWIFHVHPLKYNIYEQTTTLTTRAACIISANILTLMCRSNEFTRLKIAVNQTVDSFGRDISQKAQGIKHECTKELT